MARKTAPPAPIPDVQNRTDSRRIEIGRVGIKDIYHPVRVKDRSGGDQHTIANFNMYVFLPHNFKGTHMSRFVEILNEHEREISVESFGAMLADMTARLDSEAGHLEMTFPYFVMKKAPVSGVESLLDYRARWPGSTSAAAPRLSVVVPVTSLCPCSKGIADYGAHNQRSHVTIRRASRSTSGSRTIDIAEQEASCTVWHPEASDEKFVTERSMTIRSCRGHGPRRRRAAECRSAHPRLRDRVGELESIHNHSAYADHPTRTGQPSAALIAVRAISVFRKVLLKRSWQAAEACSSSVELTFRIVASSSATTAFRAGHPQ